MVYREALLAENIYKLLSGEFPIGAATDTSVDAKSFLFLQKPILLHIFAILANMLRAGAQIEESRYICH